MPTLPVCVRVLVCLMKLLSDAARVVTYKNKCVRTTHPVACGVWSDGGPLLPSCQGRQMDGMTDKRTDRLNTHGLSILMNTVV